MTLTSRAIVAAVIESPMNSIERSSQSRKYGHVYATWEKQVLSARGFKRVGRHSEYAI